MTFDRTRAMEIFARVAELGSFTAAANDLNMSQPAVTKSLKSLEDHLGTQLLNRSTRTLSLTDDGQLFYEDARRILEAFAEAEARVGKRAGAPNGLLKIACPIAFGRLVMTPIVKRFLEAHPLVQVELLMADRMLDLVEQGVDVAIRIGELSDSSMRAQRIGEARRGTYATPGYLARSGRPQTPADLKRHNCLVFTGLSTRNRWTFKGPSGVETIEVGGNFLCNNTEGSRAATLEGLGVAYHPEWLFSQEIADGSIIPILADHVPPPLPINAVFPAGRYVSAKTRIFVDHVKREFAKLPAVSIG